jgi:16S rRNA G527 N7-methylase RsmG
MNKQTHKTKAMKTKQETPKGRNHLLSGRVDLHTLERVKAAAEKQGVTISTVVSRALQTVDDLDYLKQLKKENPQGALDHYLKMEGYKAIINRFGSIENFKSTLQTV